MNKMFATEYTEGKKKGPLDSERPAGGYYDECKSILSVTVRYRPDYRSGLSKEKKGLSCMRGPMI